MDKLGDWIHFFETKKLNIEDLQFEQKTGLLLREANEVTKEQLLDLIKWRYGDQKHYFKRIMKLLDSVQDHEIREVTRVANSLSLDLYKMTLLCALPGVGPALASILLTLFNPEKYGFFERGVWDQIFPEETVNTSISGYLRYLNSLRKISKEHGVPVRVVEQALLAKNIEEKR